MRLLHGSTDLLQPINILPNSDFSRSDGYPSTINIGDVNSDSSQTPFVVADGIQVLVSYASVKNLTVTRTTNSLRIQGIASSKTSASGIRINFTGTFEKDTLYTFGGSAVSNNSKPLSMNSFFQNDGSTYYRKQDLNRIVAIQTTTTNAAQGLRTVVVGLPSIGDSFDFTVSDCFCYKGAYTNPPIYKSLDVLPSNQFALDTIDQPQRFFNSSLKQSSLTKLGWHRIFRMREIRTNYESAIQGSLRLIKGYTEGGYHAYNIDFACFGNNSYLKATLYTSHPSNTYATKFRLAIDPNDTSRHVYVEMYHSKEYSSGNEWILYIKDLEDYYVLLKSNINTTALTIRNNVLSDIRNPEFGILNNVVYNSDTSLKEVNTEVLTSANS